MDSCGTLRGSYISCNYYGSLGDKYDGPIRFRKRRQLPFIRVLRFRTPPEEFTEYVYENYVM